MSGLGKKLIRARRECRRLILMAGRVADDVRVSVERKGAVG